MVVPNWPIVDVWQIDLALPETCCAWELALLSDDEHGRAEKFVFPKHHRRFVRRRAALRTILARYCGEQPGRMVFSYQDRGKPELVQPEAAPTVHFNCSDTGDLALVAVAQNPIGVDIEQVRQTKDGAGLISTVCTETEAKSLERLRPSARTQAFFRIWAAKEALIKLTGKGLSAGLQEIETNLSSDPIIADQAGAQHSLTEMDFGLDYRAMVATADITARPHIRRHHFRANEAG